MPLICSATVASVPPFLTMISLKLYLFLFVSVALPLVAFGGVHHHHDVKKSHGEREADGAYSPRDAAHAGHADSFDHEAILGSAREAEEFDSLPPEEAKKKLAVLLDKMDRDGDKKISRKELKQWILRSFHLLNLEESEERFKEHDDNEDGSVSWKEYMMEEFDLQPEEEPEDEEKKIRADPDRIDELDMLEDDKLLFQASDKNSDGVLSKEEFLSFSHPEEDRDMYDAVVKSLLRSKDTNEDGVVGFQEYIGDRGKDQDKSWLVGEKDRFDKELDKNSDGSLGRSEILDWLIPSSDSIAEEEVSHLFGASDDDDDGDLSFDEVLTHHDVFVGSEATDYGDHLLNLHKFDDEL